MPSLNAMIWAGYLSGFATTSARLASTSWYTQGGGTTPKPSWGSRTGMRPVACLPPVTSAGGANTVARRLRELGFSVVPEQAGGLMDARQPLVLIAPCYGGSVSLAQSASVVCRCGQRWWSASRLTAPEAVGRNCRQLARMQPGTDDGPRVVHNYASGPDRTLPVAI
jgi:hypothetical protein